MDGDLPLEEALGEVAIGPSQQPGGIRATDINQRMSSYWEYSQRLICNSLCD